jgi:hypothetical protein
MKKIILSAALTAVLASPAFSQATMLTDPLTPAYSSQRVQPGRFAQRGYVQQQGYAAGVVAEGGRIVGQDPDPNVQLELRRDPVADY